MAYSRRRERMVCQPTRAVNPPRVYGRGFRV